MGPISIDWITGVDLDAPSLVSAAAANDVHRVSLLVHQMTPFPDWNLVGDTPERRETKRRLDDLGVILDCIDSLRLHPDTHPAIFRPTFESGAYLGARTACVLGFDPDEQRLADSLSTICAIAAEYNITMVTELNRRFTMKNLADAARVFALMEPGTGIGVELDSMHFYRYGSELGEIAQHRSLIARAQVCDGPLVGPVTAEEQMIEGRRNRLLPGEGELPLVDWTSEMPEDIVIGLEAPYLADEPHERIRRGVIRTRELIAAVEQRKAAG